MPSDPRDYKLDLTGNHQAAGKGGAPKRRAASDEHNARPFLQALFACCNVYQRIYRNVDARRYDGACPKCGKRVRFIVGPGGTPSRSFVIE